MQKIIFLDFDGVITTMASRYSLDRYEIPALKAHSFRGGMKMQTDVSR